MSATGRASERVLSRRADVIGKTKEVSVSWGQQQGKFSPFGKKLRKKRRFRIELFAEEITHLFEKVSLL
jgi:hypothetical protein